MGERNFPDTSIAETANRDLPVANGNQVSSLDTIRQPSDDQSIVSSRALVSDRSIPTIYTSEYQSISSMPIMTNKILTGTMFMTDPNAMAQVTMLGDYKLESKSLIPQSMMHVRPMYGDIKGFERRTFVGEQMCTMQPMVTDALVLPGGMMTPRLMPPKVSAIRDDMMTGITMISGKPLSGRVMVGNARAVTTRIVSSDKSSAVKTTVSEKVPRYKPAEEKMIPKAVCAPAMPKIPALLDRQPPSKLSQIDRMTAARIAVGDQQQCLKQEKKHNSPSKGQLKSGNLSEKGSKISSPEKLGYSKIDTEEKTSLSTDRASSTHSEFIFRENFNFGCDETVGSKINSMGLERTKSPFQNLDPKMSPKKLMSPIDHSSHRTILGDNNGIPSDCSSICGPATPNDKKTNCVIPGRHVVHWFRRGLRLHDNPALREAIAKCETFRCIYILDPWFAGSSNVGVNKWRYVIRSVCLQLKS